MNTNKIEWKWSHFYIVFSQLNHSYIELWKFPFLDYAQFFNTSLQNEEM